MAEQVRREVLAASGNVPVAEPRALEQVVSGSIARQQFSMTLLTIFAGLALFLGALGLYGVMSYSVAQRTRELGIRSALGAAKEDLLKMVIGQGMCITAIGLVIGLIASFGLMRFLQNMLYGVKPFDAPIFIAVTLLLAAVAFFASFLPARRAANIDPLIALRDE